MYLATVLERLLPAELRYDGVGSTNGCFASAAVKTVPSKGELIRTQTYRT